MSRQELIAAQREATRANQRAILSASSNAERGLDVLLPDRALLRSSQIETENIRYSYVDPDGGTYDISDIIEAELRRSPTDMTSRISGGDLLEGAVRDPAKLDRVLNKIKDGRQISTSSTSESIVTTSVSTVSDDYATTRGSSQTPVTSASRTETPVSRPNRMTPSQSRESFDTPTIAQQRVVSPVDRIRSSDTGRSSPNMTSIGRVMSPTSPYSRDTTPGPRYGTPSGSISISSRAETPNQFQPRRTTPGSPATGASPALGSKNVLSPPPPTPASPNPKKTAPPLDDASFDRMWGIIQAGSLITRPPTPEPPSAIDVLIGKKIKVDDYHPELKDIFGPLLKEFRDVQNVGYLDAFYLSSN
jgi:hypothetical protein